MGRTSEVSVPSRICVRGNSGKGGIFLIWEFSFWESIWEPSRETGERERNSGFLSSWSLTRLPREWFGVFIPGLWNSAGCGMRAMEFHGLRIFRAVFIFRDEEWGHQRPPRRERGAVKSGGFPQIERRSWGFFFFWEKNPGWIILQRLGIKANPGTFCGA